LALQLIKVGVFSSFFSPFLTPGSLLETEWVFRFVMHRTDSTFSFLFSFKVEGQQKRKNFSSVFDEQALGGRTLTSSSKLGHVHES
jgi:hypothetical protein